MSLPAPVPLASPFEESAYLEAYPEVRKAVAAGRFQSGKQHYFLKGFRERRKVVGAAEVATAAPPAGTPAEQRDFAFYHTNGFLVIDSGLAEKTIDRALREVAGVYTGDGPPTRGGDAYGAAYADATRIQDAWKMSTGVREIANAPAVLATLRMLYGGRRAFPFQTLNFRCGSEQPVHSDTVHFNSAPSGLMVGVWLALEDIDYQRGPLVYYPGSHRLPEILTCDVQGEDGEMDYPRYEKLIETAIVKSGVFAPSHACIRKGQALIWAANLHHGGSPRSDKTLTRHSQVTHYFFEGSTYWTPRLSTATNRVERTPAPIAPTAPLLDKRTGLRGRVRTWLRGGKKA